VHQRAQNKKEFPMGIGLGIVLLVIGLILLLGAIDLPVAVDNVVATETLGWILVIVGALAIILVLVTNAQHSRASRVDRR
jgi:uncharacterized membrane protein HdeD (DUF308 family)